MLFYKGSKESGYIQPRTLGMLPFESSELKPHNGLAHLIEFTQFKPLLSYSMVRPRIIIRKEKQFLDREDFKLLYTNESNFSVSHSNIHVQYFELIILNLKLLNFNDTKYVGLQTLMKSRDSGFKFILKFS